VGVLGEETSVLGVPVELCKTCELLELWRDNVVGTPGRLSNDARVVKLDAFDEDDPAVEDDVDRVRINDDLVRFSFL
jgi:hypothetical protein